MMLAVPMVVVLFCLVLAIVCGLLAGLVLIYHRQLSYLQANAARWQRVAGQWQDAAETWEKVARQPCCALRLKLLEGVTK